MVYIVPDENLNLYFMTHADTEKHQNIMRHPKIALVVTDESRHETLQVQGSAEVLEDATTKQWILRAFTALPSTVAPWQPPVHQQGGAYSFIKITPKRMRMAQFRGEGEPIFTQIVP